MGRMLVNYFRRWTLRSGLWKRCKQSGESGGTRHCHHGHAAKSEENSPNTCVGEFVVTQLDGPKTGIIVVGLNRPQRRNAIDFNFLRQMRRAVDTAAQNEAARVVILRSLVPNIFCAGADLKEREQLPLASYKRWSLSIRALLTSLERLPVPTIAALDGPALGGGLEIALACDLRVAASNARLGLPETGLGIIPGAGGTQRLARLVGQAVAKEMILTTRSVVDLEAAALGLVNRIVQQDSTAEAAYRAAEELALDILRQDNEAVRQAKLQLVQVLEGPFTDS